MSLSRTVPPPPHVVHAKPLVRKRSSGSFPRQPALAKRLPELFAARIGLAGEIRERLEQNCIPVARVQRLLADAKLIGPSSDALLRRRLDGHGPWDNAWIRTIDRQWPELKLQELCDGYLGLAMPAANDSIESY